MVDCDAGIGGYLDTADMLESRLEFLEGKEKILMEMRLRQGATFGQIAALTGMHQSTVARQVQKLRGRLLKGAFVVCLRNRECLSDQQLAIARDRYLTRLPIPLIAKKQKCTLYRVRTVLVELANLVEGTKIS
jgi:DNA-binding transcriptional ArsR family regulator